MLPGDNSNPSEALPAALQMMAKAKSSGSLSIRDGEKMVLILIAQGHIVFASSTSGARLGDSMVEKGVLGEEELAQALAVQKRKKVKQPLATILHELGLVSREAAGVIVEQQIYEVLREAMSWTRGKLDFEPMTEGFDNVIRPESCSVERVLLRLALA